MGWGKQKGIVLRVFEGGAKKHYVGNLVGGAVNFHLTWSVGDKGCFGFLWVLFLWEHQQATWEEKH